MFFKRAVNAVPLFALAVVATVYAQGAYGDQPGPILSERAAAIHAQVLTVDTHIDWPIRQSFNPEFDPSIRHETGAADSGQWDLPRMEAGQLDAAFMSIFTPQKERSPAGYAAADELANQLIDMTEQMVARSPDKAELALTPEDA